MGQRRRPAAAALPLLGEPAAAGPGTHLSPAAGAAAAGLLCCMVEPAGPTLSAARAWLLLVDLRFKRMECRLLYAVHAAGVCRLHLFIWTINVFFIPNFKYSEQYIHFDLHDELFAILNFNLSFEIVLYRKKLNILQNKLRALKLVELVRKNNILL